MADGIVSPKKRLLLRLAFLIEGRFADVAECTQDGGGIQETRPEYLRRYRRTLLRDHVDGTRRALVMTLAARTRFEALKTLIQQRRAAGAADDEEVEIADLPAETTLDASWDA